MSLALSTTACAAAPACPPDRVCGTSSWIPASGAAGVEGPMVIASASEIAGAAPPGAFAERVPLGNRPVLIRFDLAAIEGREVERATLSIVPHPGWHPAGRPLRLYARAVTGGWAPEAPEGASAAYLDPDPIADAVLPGRTRAPLRLDVTAALRAWQAGVAGFDGLALSTTGEGVVIQGPAALAPSDRPRLEVVLR